MLQLYPTQLRERLDINLYTVYFLCGNDYLLIQESCNTICEVATTHGFHEHHTFQINQKTDWRVIFSLCQKISLFSSRQIIQIVLPEHSSETVINQELKKLVHLLHKDILLIIQSNNQFITFQKNVTWLTTLLPHSVQVICLTPKKENLLQWVINRAKINNLQLDNLTCQMLCHYYEGNLFALDQALERLSLLWSDGILTMQRVEKVVHNAAHFIPFHWTEALLMNKSKRSLHILKQLRLENNDPTILVRSLQRELLLLINFKRKLIHIPLFSLFKQYQIWKSRQTIIREALNRLSKAHLYHSIRLLTNIELMLKQKYTKLVWNKLEEISLFLCDK